MKKVSRTLAIFMVIAMCVWTLSACGSEKSSSTEESVSNNYTATKVTSKLSMADDVKAFYEAANSDKNMKYAYSLSYDLAYDWDNLADHLGWRSAGSDAEHACAEYLEKEMNDIGLQNVEKIGTKCDRFQFNDSLLTIKDADIEIKDIASYQCNGTQQRYGGDLEAEIVDCGWGHEEDYADKDMAGKIALVHVDQYNETWIDSYIDQAAEANAAALVTWANSGYGEANKDTINVQDICCGDLLPTAAISANEAKQIKQAIKEGNNQCTLKLDAELNVGTGTTYNVCGMIPGKSHDQRIIVAGHYDKYWYGFQDDCAAIGLVFAVAKAMLQSGYEPENDIYFICHGAEEWGVSDSMFDWTTGAWGMVDDEGWADNTIALLNCELPAYEPGQDMQISCVPEFFGLVDKMFNSGLLITSGDKAFQYEPGTVNTMEDGISYREYGTPYLINGFENPKFVCSNYHTITDDADTYDPDIFQTNIDWYGAYAIYLDTEPALELNFVDTAKQLKEDFNKDYAKEADIDTAEYNDAIKELKASAKEMNQKIKACNDAYEAAVVDGDEEAMAAAREEGKELNQKSLEVFQMVQDSFLLVTDLTTNYGHQPINWDVEMMDGVLDGLERGDVWTDEEDGAADYAGELNAELDWMYYTFSMDVSKETPIKYSMSYYRDKDHAQWGWNHLPPQYDVHDAVYALMHADTIEDIDADAVKTVYENARAKAIQDIGNYCTKEISDMKAIAEMLK